MSDDSAGSTEEVVDPGEGSISQESDSSCTTKASEQPDTGSNMGECDTEIIQSLKTQFMLLGPVSSLTRYALGLSVVDRFVCSQVTNCCIVNTTDTPISLPDRN